MCNKQVASDLTGLGSKTVLPSSAQILNLDEDLETSVDCNPAKSEG